jgi:hypothetical protein
MQDMYPIKVLQAMYTYVCMYVCRYVYTYIYKYAYIYAGYVPH